eukprot:CAMPEP_0181327698 /NCGR_PEP_ID=MMETSP1101-20121128/22259_1 /TAXON_ID=46948 /ORGANISM="Rhodomonas abbreviata, Strain Caron Lab Isolate" /LENGTH=38 /DNA_ID= /DNA_START= /DNA_END= /DNA_ORIENTATION=
MVATEAHSPVAANVDVTGTSHPKPAQNDRHLVPKNRVR